MKGQLEISFQWIYVLIAGGAFLFLFFFAFKSCTNTTEQRANGMSISSAATMLSTASWQPESVRNTTINAQVSCVAGVMTLSQNDMHAQIQRTPIFLPPLLSGKEQFITQEVSFEKSGVPAITYGNVLYVADEHTIYFALDGATLPVQNVRPVTRATLRSESIPDGTKTLIIISQSDLANLQVPQTNAAVYGVSIIDGNVQFYNRTQGVLVADGMRVPVPRKLESGAYVSGTKEIYQCAAANFVLRARDISGVYTQRGTMILANATQYSMPQACKDQYTLATNIYSAARTDDEVLSALFDDRLLLAQDTLYRLDCPVIA